MSTISRAFPVILSSANGSAARLWKNSSSLVKRRSHYDLLKPCEQTQISALAATEKQSRVIVVSSLFNISYLLRVF